jgi:hypothetical protein
LADIISHSSFKKLNYNPYYYLGFKIPIIENNVERLKDISPDVLLWNNKANIVLIIEVKGGNSIKEEDINQLAKYERISIRQVQTRLRNITDNPNIIIEKIFVGIVYNESTIESCRESEPCIERLEGLKTKYMVFTQSSGSKLKILNPHSLNFDINLKNELEEGFDLPMNPPRTIYLTDTPCLKGTIWGIVNYVHDCFFSGEEIDEIAIEPFDLKERDFSYSRVKPSRLKIALEYLKEFKLCIRNEFKYIFYYITFSNPQNIFEQILNINCELPLPIQKNLLFRPEIEEE